MPLRYRRRILDHLQQDQYHPATVRQIARDLRVDPAEHELFEQAVKDLVESGEAVLENGHLRLPPAPKEITGKIKVNARGFGFVIPDQPVREGDIFIPPDNLADAVNGDRVRIRLIVRRNQRGGRRGNRVGRVIEIVERGQTKFVGALYKEGKTWLVEADGGALRDPIVIRDPHAKNAKAGDKVVVELTQYPEGDHLPEGVITEVLGESGRPSVETQAVITAHGLRDHFEEDVLEEARAASQTFDQQAEEGWPGREDLRDRFTITIDPPDAKDFDDAITLERDEEADEWTLGVHIADVAHFVTRGSALDREAVERGNSVYLPRLVLPMLPEVLSNGVCSLQEGVPRMTKSVFITFDSKGRVQGQRVSSTVIESNKRLTYLEAQALIDGDKKAAHRHARTDTEYTEELIDTLRAADRLAKVLRKRRRRDGMITLDLPEVELVFDDEGHVIDVVPEDDAFTHTIIEMFMVEANEAVARLFDDLRVPLIRRIHPDPAVGKMEVLQIYSLVAGVRIPDQPTRKDLQNLLEATRDSPAARAIHFAVLRTLTKATYSPAMIGHYALASEHYTHFTSPIRRYPDLSVHRALQAFLEATDNGRNVPRGRKRDKLAERIAADNRVLDEGELIQLGNHCSDTEVEAEAAERELRSFLVMQFLEEKHLGDVFTGVVTGVTKAGVFVSIEKFLVEGLVKTDALPEPGGRADRWQVNEHTMRLTAQRSGQSIGLGDEVEIQIVAIDLSRREMDLLIKSMPERGKATAGPRAGRRSRRKAEQSAERKKTPDGKKKHRKGHGKGRRGRKGGRR